MANLQKKQSIYFPHLHGLRFIASFIVLIHHIDGTILTRQGAFDYESELYFKLHLRALSGHLGVILFFVLSGFLITYLLLVEKKENKRIKIRDFYIRRILRIWPLYFLVIVLATFILFTNKIPDPKILGTQIVFFILFLPHILRFLTGCIPYSNHLWSIGVEEQFYLLWPIFIQKIRLQLLLPLISVLICIIVILKAIFSQVNMLIALLDMVHMMIGSIFAIIYFQKERFAKLLKLLYSLPLQLIAYSLIIGLIYTGWRVPFFRFETYSFCFGILILNLATNPKNFIYLEQDFVRFLGKISYGVYMLHPFCLLCSEKILDYFKCYHHSSHFLLSVLLTLAVATLSYWYFESFFLGFKKRFLTVNTSSS